VSGYGNWLPGCFFNSNKDRGKFLETEQETLISTLKSLFDPLSKVILANTWNHPITSLSF